MSTVQKSSHDFDLESANNNDIDIGRNADGGGGGGDCCSTTQVAAVGEGHEIVRVLEGNVDCGDNSTEMVDKKRESNVSECSVEMVDLESGTNDTKQLHLKRDCRICHLSMDATNNQDSGIPFELGCSCKNDLAAAHSQCAESWFKIKGNKTCEICGSIAQNVTGINEAELMEQWNEETNDAAVTTARRPESRNFWKGHRFLNFLLACMVFAFVISWLFHFNVPS